MNTKLLNQTVTIVALEKHGLTYAMTCAWVTQLDYDKVGCLIGEQSVTGKTIKIGDVIGLSALGKKQKKIAATLGEGHSDKVNKLKGIEFTNADGAILIRDAKMQMKCKVVDIVRLKDMENDLFVVLHVVGFIENYGTKFLMMEDIPDAS